MSKIKDTVKKVAAVVANPMIASTAAAFKKGGEAIGNVLTPEINFPEPPPPQIMPDMEEQRRIERRNAANRTGGRASTLLSSTLG